MSGRNIRTLLDASLTGHNLKVECRMCGRWRILSAGRLFWFYKRKRWAVAIDRAHEHLRCAGCGRKELMVSLTYSEPTDAMPPRATGPLGVVRGGKDTN